MVNGQWSMKLRVPYWATEGFDVKLNGKSIATHYQPSSYVEIPIRQWTKKDVVEVVMPFNTHIDFGPDKIDNQWLGAFMRGPLVMAATGITTWDEATIDLTSSPSHILTFLPSHLHFIPDYDGNEHLTHYFRLLLPTALVVDGGSVNIDKSQLHELLLIAQARSDEQQAWNAMDVKVPEYAPWAKYGFRRMTDQMTKVRPILDAPEGKYTQDEIDKAASSLNAEINSMRPGNLAELEDMQKLLAVLDEVKTAKKTDAASREAIDYASMVIRYVSNGSGTIDMIERAVRQLKEVLE